MDEFALAGLAEEVADLPLDPCPAQAGDSVKNLYDLPPVEGSMAGCFSVTITFSMAYITKIGNMM